MKTTPPVALIAAMFAISLNLTGCGGGSSSFTAAGTVDVLGTSKTEVLAADSATTGDRCQGVGALNDVTGGSEVLVLDSTGKKVAVGELSEGALPEGVDSLSQLGLTPCRFTFEVSDVPDDGGLFTLQVGADSETTFKKSEAGELKVSITTR